MPSSDDDGPTRTLLRLLRMGGYTIDEAPDGPAAMNCLAQAPADLLLVDVMMPGQDGLELLGEIRRTSDVPVILLTAKSDDGDRVVGLRSGADDVVKPLLDRRARRSHRGGPAPGRPSPA